MAIWKSLIAAGVGAFMFVAPSASYAVAPAANFTIDATKPINAWQVVINAVSSAASYTFDVVNQAERWSAGSGPTRTSYYYGISTRYFPLLTQDGFSAKYGSLVLSWGPGKYKLLTPNLTVSGSDFGNNATVKVGYWDSFYNDNSGFQHISLTSTGGLAAPGPIAGAGLPLLLGFAGLVVWRRRQNLA